MNNYQGYYRNVDYHETDESRKNKRGTPLFLLIVLSLAAGLVGGGISWYFLNSNEETVNPTVTIQTVSPDSVRNIADNEYGSMAEAVAVGAGPTVVEVSTESKKTHPFFGSYVTGGAGSGVIISADGHIVTNHHVIEDSISIQVRLHDGREYAARLLGTDSQTDLAVLKVDANDLSAAIFADSDSTRVGQPVVAIGNPLGTLGGTVTEGIISAKDREIVIGGDVMELLQTSAAINPGNSGGGLFNRDGHLIGVVNAKSSGSDIEGLGFAIPSNTAKAVVADLIENGYVTGRPTLGVEVVDINSVQALYQYRVNDFGVYITAVSGNDNALQRGDYILKIAGEPINSSLDIKRVVNQYAVGDSVEVTIRRGNHDKSIIAVLQEKTT